MSNEFQLRFKALIKRSHFKTQANFLRANGISRSTFTSALSGDRPASEDTAREWLSHFPDLSHVEKERLIALSGDMRASKITVISPTMERVLARQRLLITVIAQLVKLIRDAGLQVPDRVQKTLDLIKKV